MTLDEVLTEKIKVEAQIADLIRQFKRNLPEHVHISEIHILQTAHSGTMISLNLELR